MSYPFQLSSLPHRLSQTHPLSIPEQLPEGELLVLLYSTPLPKITLRSIFPRFSRLFLDDGALFIDNIHSLDYPSDLARLARLQEALSVHWLHSPSLDSCSSAIFAVADVFVKIGVISTMAEERTARVGRTVSFSVAAGMIEATAMTPRCRKTWRIPSRITPIGPTAQRQAIGLCKFLTCRISLL